MNETRERSKVQWGNTEIAYAIRRSDRRRTVALSVFAPDQVVLTAPAGTSVEKLDEVVHAKAQWITSRLNDVRSTEPEPAPREFVSGESFRYLGRQYRLDVFESVDAAPVHLAGGRLRVAVTRSANAHDRTNVVRAALVEWYRRHAESHLPERVAWWSSRLEVTLPRTLIRDQEKRWGSCTPDVLRLNWRIMQVSTQIIDYVVAHEVVHLIHNHHGKDFWAALGRVMPDYEKRRAELQVLGPSMVW